MKEFAGKIVIITGAGTGIGRAYAKGFCRDGAIVFGIGRTKKILEETREECGESFRYHVGDITNESHVEMLFKTVKSDVGYADILINNAAVYPKKSFLDSTHAEWCQVLRTNVMGMALCSRYALPPMLDSGYGRIINIGSFAWRGPIVGASAYSVSKGAVRVFTKALATEIDRSRYPNVLVNELVPGMVKTAMSDKGEEPDEVYIHAKFVVSLPSGGPTGETFDQSTLHDEDYGIRARLARFTKKLIAYVR